MSHARFFAGLQEFAALRSFDTFVKIDGAWFFAELYVDWGDKEDLGATQRGQGGEA